MCVCVCECITFPQVWVCNNFFIFFTMCKISKFSEFFEFFEFFSQIQWFFENSCQNLKKSNFWPD